MPPPYIITIEPVTENEDEVHRILTRFIGSRQRISRLIESGGVVRETEDENEANLIKERLQEAGAQVEVERSGSRPDGSEEPDIEEAFQDEPLDSETPIEDTEGIGLVRAEKLGAIGYETAADVIDASSGDLTEANNVGDSLAERILDTARGRTIPARDLEESVTVPVSTGVMDYAAGAFVLPAGGGSVEISDVGFEPDLLLLTASNAVVAGDATDQIRGTTDGWSYGAACRTASGAIKQHVVAVADDAARPDVAMAAANLDRSLHVVAADDQGGVGGRTGRVERTTAEGFVFVVDQPVGQANASGPRPVVLYRAFELGSPRAVKLGHFQTPTEPGVQSVDLDIPADHVTLTACTALDDLDTARQSEESVAVSIGDVISRETLQQVVTAGGVTPSTAGLSSTVAATEQAIHLPHERGPALEGRTTARATGLGRGLQLEYDEGHSNLQLEYDEGHSNAGATPSDGPSLVSYVAMTTGERMVPTVGYFELPGPSEDADRSVDTGFEPGLVEFTVCDTGELGEQVATASPLPWGRSHGVAVKAEGRVDQYLLHGAVDPDQDGGPAGPADRLRNDRVGAGLATNGGTGARITGRDDLVVTAMTPTGFDVRTTHVSTDARDPTTGSGNLVFYKAWPKPER